VYLEFVPDNAEILNQEFDKAIYSKLLQIHSIWEVLTNFFWGEDIHLQ
jgi:hypothetical protein